MAKDLSADGLRGVAALNVFFAHFLLAFFPAGFTHFFPDVASAQAAQGLAERIISAPVISVMWNGRFPVCVFFVLSGYVLTKAYLDRGSLDVVRSLAARRYLRLGVPVFASTMFAFAIMSIGGYQSPATAALTQSTWLSAMWSGKYSFDQALREGLYGAILTGTTSYNPAFWTMRIEFIGSLLVLAYRVLAWPGSRGWIAAATYVALIVFLSPSVIPPLKRRGQK